MFSSRSFSREWIEAVAKQSGTQDVVVDKCIRALALVARLSEAGLDFVFKGGTSLMLHLNPVRRLSIDVDIASLEPLDWVREVLSRIADGQPFIRWEHQDWRDAATGGARFAIADGVTTHARDGGPLAAHAWTHLAVVFSGATGTLYVNGAPVASNPAMTLFPDRLNAPLMVRMRDRNGNTTGASAPAAVTCQAGVLPAAAFSYGPIGVANGRIAMTAAKPMNAAGKIEFKFDRTSPTPDSSGWQSASTWIQAGLTAGASCAYTITLRDAGGNVSAPSAPATAVARDEAPPQLPIPVAHWDMLPYATIDNKVSMTAMAATDAAGIEYQFRCVSGGGPDSAWQSGRTYVTPALADGTYGCQYRVRDTSPQRNTSGYSTSYAPTITPTTGYHTYALSQVLTAADDYLVSFPATVMQLSTNHYWGKDLASGAGIKVRPSTSNQVTDLSLALNNVLVKGHRYTFGGVPEVTFATVTGTGNPTLATVANSSGGIDIAWPDTDTGQLLWSGSVDAAADWLPVGLPPVHAGGWYTVTVMPGPNTTFFRLRH
jgi:hypothetical protein